MLCDVWSPEPVNRRSNTRTHVTYVSFTAGEIAVNSFQNTSYNVTCDLDSFYSKRSSLIRTVAPIMKKPGAGSGNKSGLGSLGRSALGGKSGTASSAKSALGSSSKTNSSASKGLSLTAKSPISKSGASLSKSASPKPSKSFDFSSDKTKSLTPSSPKSYPSSSSYNVYGKPKTGKSATFGIIWIPTGKRNKKKDIVLSYDNDDRRRERSPSFYKLMSGDSHDQPHKKKDEDSDLLVPDRKLPSAVAATETAIAANIASPNLDEQQHLIRHDNEESKEGAGDSKDTEDTDEDKEYLSNEDTVRHKLPDTTEVDSVYLRPPPPHKTRSNASNSEEDSCGIKCLYYTLQCCDCVLM